MDDGEGKVKREKVEEKERRKERKTVRGQKSKLKGD